MAKDKVKALYDTFVKEGYQMESEAEFRKNLADPAKRKAAYEALKKDGYEMEAYDAFETNIGYGKTATAQSVAPVPTAPPADKPAVQAAPESASKDSGKSNAESQPGRKPTAQDKIRWLHGVNTIVADFNKDSRGRVEKAKRVTEHFTPEGRKKLKAKKFQAQLAGTPTQVMGITPDTSGDKLTEGTPGESQGGVDERKPWMSGQGPVPYGVVTTEEGKRKTQWLLPDGTITKDFAEADRAEYGARRVRLMNKFIGRMRENGLDPKKQEDIQKQAQLDYEAPIRKAVASALAEDDTRSNEEHEAYMRDPANMVGGVNAALGHVAIRKQSGIGDLSLIAEKAYNSLPEHYRRELVTSYVDYFKKHPEALHGKTLEKASQDAAKSVVYGQVHEEYVRRNTPESKNEFFLRKLFELNPASVTLSSTVNPKGQTLAEMEAMERYGAQHKGLALAGTVAGMAIDPLTYLGGWAGHIAFEKATKLAGKMMAKKAMGNVAGRFAATTLAGRLIGGIAAGGANLATYEAGKDAERQVYQGGYLNPDTGEMESFSFGSVFHSGVHGLGMGAVTGMVSPLIGNVADKAVKATSSLGGKKALRTGEVAVSKLMEGTVFAMPDIYTIQSMPDGKFDSLYSKKYGYENIKDEGKRAEARKKARNDMSGDAWNDSMAMMMGFGLSHAVKTAPSVIRSLRPVRPANGRPLSREERIHNNRSFRERVRENLDRSPSDIAFTKEEREELKRKGYGELSSLFTFDPEHKSRKVDIGIKGRSETPPADKPAPQGGDVNGLHGLVMTRDYDAEIRETGNPDFDGYEAMERLMEDESVSEATRAKAYHILTGRNLTPSTVTGWSKEKNEDGRTIVTSHNQQGGVVTSRTFSNDKEVQREIDRIERQVELNTIDVGEQYRKAEAEFYGRESARPETIRERISEETGVDIDKAIRKEPGERSKAEQDAVKLYVKDLFPEEAQEREEMSSSGGIYEPSPEETEADRIYEESHMLYERLEQGDPEAEAEMDAITLRMKEAYELCEDAFGDESEVYMAQIREYPWDVLNDSVLTSDQKEAVLYYINAKAALDGVLDASNEALTDKRKAVEGEVERRTHKERGVIVPATMKIDDAPVYIIKGEVVMFPDGSDVDVRNSSDTLIILNESGEYRFTSPGEIKGVGDVIDPREELQSAYDAIDREQEEFIGAVTGEEVMTDGTAGSPGDGQAGEEAIGIDKIEGSVPEMPENAENPTENREIVTESVPNPAFPVENAQETALSRIPLHEETGEPMFEAVDKETAWDALVEVGGSDKDAADIAMAQVEQANADLEALKKKQPTMKAPKLKGSPMAMAKAKQDAQAKYAQELADYNQRVADTQEKVRAWTSILGVHNNRTSELRRQQEEERRQRDAEAHDEAVAQFEEEMRQKAEREAGQASIGTHAVNPKIKEKWDSANKVEGHADAITLPDGSTIRGRYVLTEAGAASASHDVNKGYQPTEGFPVDENGQSVNDRDYLRDKDAQRIVEQMAGAYDNRALQTPVIVSQDGVVLSGNNRTMSGDLAAKQGTDKAYTDYLREFGAKYGFTPEQVDGMEHPRLVFVPDEALPYDATTFSRFNAQEMKSQGKPEAAVKLGKIVPDNVFNDIVTDIAKYDRLPDYYKNEEETAHALGALMQAGVINDKQMPEMRTGTALSAAGKELIENTLIGKVFQSSPDAVRQIISMAGVRHTIVMGLNEIANNRTLAKEGFDLSGELAKAVDLVYRAKSVQPDVYTEGMPVSPFGRQMGLFDDEFGESIVTDATTLLLADYLNSGKHGDLRKVLATYNNEAVK